jgi:hypothetical protein
MNVSIGTVLRAFIGSRRRVTRLRHRQFTRSLHMEGKSVRGGATNITILDTRGNLAMYVVLQSQGWTPRGAIKGLEAADFAAHRT